MNPLDALQEACNQPRYTSFATLAYGIYKVSTCEKEKTGFGDRLRIEIPSKQAYLYMPERISNKLKDSDIAALHKLCATEEGLYFLYIGRDMKSRAIHKR